MCIHISSSFKLLLVLACYSYIIAQFVYGKLKIPLRFLFSSPNAKFKTMISLPVKYSHVAHFHFSFHCSANSKPSRCSQLK